MILWNKFIEGTPASKGSMQAYAIKRKGKWRGYATHSNKSKAWETIIQKQLNPNDMLSLDGSLGVDLLFQLPRGKTVKRDFPNVYPDIDKLARAVLDGLKGVIKDDARIVDLKASKRYADSYEHVGVKILISRVE